MRRGIDSPGPSRRWTGARASLVRSAPAEAVVGRALPGRGVGMDFGAVSGEMEGTASVHVRVARLASVRAEALTCRACRLWQTRRQVVFGEGNPEAALMLVGEGPGQVEDRVGRPFVGPAGKLLDRALAEAGIERSDLWITNVVKSRPAERVGGKLRNRPPRMDEIEACRPWLTAELQIVQPAVIVCLGASGANGVIHPGFKIGEEHSRWFPGPLGAVAMATYHPSYPLRLTGPSFDRVMATIVDDLARAYRRARGAEAEPGRLLSRR